MRFTKLLLRASLLLPAAAMGCDSSNKNAADVTSAASDSQGDADAGAASDSSKASEQPDPENDSRTEDGDSTQAPRYAVATIASAGDESVSYVSLLEKLQGQTLDFANAREFSGEADLWVLGDELFIADGEALQIAKFRLKDDQLEKQGAINFSNTGVPGVGFWTSVFVSREKAYVFDKREAIVWDPTKLEITGSISLPELESRGSLTGFISYTDRAAVLRGNRLFVPVYWTNEDDFFSYDAKSRILVIDVEKDEVVDSLEAPCPGLDFATEDEAGNIYFSSWVFAPPAAAVFDQPATCVAKIAADNHRVVENAFNVSDITAGHEGGALRYIGDGRAILSVFHPEHDQATDDISAIAFGPNWRFWIYDLKTGEASEIEAIAWNAGAAYTSKAGQDTFMLVPNGDYSSTKVYRVTGSIDPKPVLETKGWSMRLFQLR